MPYDQGGNWAPGIMYDQGGNPYCDQPPDGWGQKPKPRPLRWAPISVVRCDDETEHDPGRDRDPEVERRWYGVGEWVDES